MNYADLSEMTIDDLLNLPIIEDLQKVMNMLEKTNSILAFLAGKDEPESLTETKIGTVIILGILQKFADGKLPTDFTKEDWGDIKDRLAKYAVYMEGDEYSRFIFNLYAQYIESSVQALPGSVADERISSIISIAEEIRSQTDEFTEGNITESAYTENCLWLCLEAMVKLLSAYLGAFTVEEFSYLGEAAASFAFEYSRLKLLQEEQALLRLYIENQYALDRDLQLRFEEYKKALAEESVNLQNLIKNAFDSDIHSALIGSAILARSVGVKEENILDTIEKIDDFFLN